MEKLDIKDNGLHVYDVPECYQYVINRGTFELSKAASNIAFMLDKHLDDPDWLDSELYQQLEHRLFETSINNWVYTTFGDAKSADGIHGYVVNIRNFKLHKSANVIVEGREGLNYSDEYLKQIVDTMHIGTFDDSEVIESKSDKSSK